MKRTLTLTSALLGASLLASPVLAQTGGVSVGADTGVTGNVGIGSSAGDLGATGSANVGTSVGVTGSSGSNSSADVSTDANANATADVSAGSGNGDTNVGAGGSTTAGATADADTDAGDDGSLSAGNSTSSNSNTNATADADDDSDVDDTTTASTGDENNGFEGFLEAIGSDEGVQGIAGFQQGQSVTIVRADSFCESDLEQQCIDAMNSNQAQMTAVQGAIQENDVMMEALASQNVEASAVVAARTNADGSVTVFTR